MKKFKQLLICGIIAFAVVPFMSSCDNTSTKVDGGFYFSCSEDFLQFFSPHLTYVSPWGDTTIYVLTIENMEVNDASQTYDFFIPINANFLGFETSIEVKYIYNGNTNYSMADKLQRNVSGGISSISYKDAQGIHIIQNFMFNLDLSTGEKDKKTAQECIEEIKNAVDYLQLVVSKEAKVTQNTNNRNNPVDQYINFFEGKKYSWEETYPAIQEDYYSGWLDKEKRIHTAREYESLTHSMTISGVKGQKVNLTERLDRLYTSAYKYIGNEESPIFILHEDDWELFDTTYHMVEEKVVSLSYSINYPNVAFSFNDIYVNASTGYVNYDYSLISWDSSLPPFGKLTSDDTLVCTFNTKSNGETVSIKRTFVKQ